MIFLSKKIQKQTVFDILDRKECFLDLKSEVLKKSRKSTFCKGVSPWFLSKNRPFSNMFFFFSKTSQKQTVFEILDRKECFLDQKSEVLQKSRKSTFCKGVSPFFLSKNRPFSYMFFLSKNSQKKTVFDILENKEYFLDLKSEIPQKSKKSIFCKGVSPWFLSKNRPFSYMNFLSKNSQKQKVFDILDRKECFLDLKSEVLKKSRKSTFCKGVSPWFLSKNRPFSNMFFFFSKTSQKQTVFEILDRKECFLDQKSEVLQKSRKSTFCKGVSPFFLSKNRPFSYMFFLSKNSQKKTVFDILENKEYFLDLKSEIPQKSKKSIFCKGVSPWFLSKNRPFSYMFFLSKKSKKETFFDILDRK